MAADPLIGQVLHDTHEIVRRIGVGGMGTVYEAVHMRLRKQRFAVKVLHARMMENEAIYTRFRQEAEVATEIGHPNIVYVTDFYETSEGQPCIVMEYLEGEDLAQRMKQQKKLAMSEIIQILEQVGSALQAVHDEGVVHRDLKPGNIFLCNTRDGSVRAKVLDFGISKIRDSGASITGDQAVLGTPSYMSPEQGEGRVNEVDTRTDIFALGIICYRMLCNELPFSGPTMIAVIRAICDKPHKPITSHRPGLGAELESVLDRALAKDKEQRYSRIKDFAREFKAAAQKITTEEPVAAAPPEGGALPPLPELPVWSTKGQEEEATTPIPVETAEMLMQVATDEQTVSRPEEPTPPPAFGPMAKTKKVVEDATEEVSLEEVALVVPDVKPPPAPLEVTPAPIAEEVTPAPIAEEVTPAPIAEEVGVGADTTLTGAMGEMPAAVQPAVYTRGLGRFWVAAAACTVVLTLAGVGYLMWEPAANTVVEPEVMGAGQAAGDVEEAPVTSPDAAVEVAGPDLAPDQASPDLEPPPVVKKPAPVVKKPAPVVDKPAPVVKKPAPVVKKPAPVVKKPAPTVKKEPTVKKRPAVRKRPALKSKAWPDEAPVKKPKPPASSKKRPAFEDL